MASKNTNIVSKTLVESYIRKQVKALKQSPAETIDGKPPGSLAFLSTPSARRATFWTGVVSISELELDFQVSL